jgi:uncharacterized membrane protein
MYRQARAFVLRHRESLVLGGVLVLSSLAALAILAARAFYGGTAGYLFMVWNLFLAWIPLWLAVPIGALASRGRPASALLLALGFLWLLFFPNAPYLLTEFQHLHPRHAVSARPLVLLAGVSPGRGVPLWYDVVLVLLFAWNGLLLGLVSMRLVQRAVARRLGAGWGWVSVVGVFALSGFGVTLGRFQRWNSWDLFSRPAALAADVGGRLFNPLAHPRTTGATVLLASFLLLAYLAVLALTGVPRTDDATESPGPRHPRPHYF